MWSLWKRHGAEARNAVRTPNGAKSLLLRTRNMSSTWVCAFLLPDLPEQLRKDLRLLGRALPTVVRFEVGVDFSETGKRRMSYRVKGPVSSSFQFVQQMKWC